MKNILFLTVLLFSSINLMAQNKFQSESAEEIINGVSDFKTEIPKGLSYKKTENYDLLKVPLTKKIISLSSESKMKVYTSDCNCEITNYKPKNFENSNLKIYNPKITLHSEELR